MEGRVKNPLEFTRNELVSRAEFTWKNMNSDSPAFVSMSKLILTRNHPIHLTREDELAHLWTIRPNTASCDSEKLIVEMLSKDLKRGDPDWDSPTNRYHRDFCTQKRDEEAREFRGS